MALSGDLILPGAERTDTCEFPEAKRASKFVITGCIVLPLCGWHRSLHGVELLD